MHAASRWEGAMREAGPDGHQASARQQGRAPLTRFPRRLHPAAADSSSSSSLDAPQNGGKVFAMRHGNRTARLGRPADQRKALIRSLVTEVLRHGKITTTKVGVYWAQQVGGRQRS